MNYFLVVGGTGVMGTAAIQAVRKQFGKDATIIANWFGKEDTGISIENADHTVFGDITDQNCIDEILSIHSGSYKYLFYATALGEVGTPIKDATQEQIEQSHRLSYDPILQLEDQLTIETVVAYSTFYTIKHQLSSYGAMGYSKEAIEKWTVQPGKSRHLCIRAGLFESPSSRGIKLLLRKAAKNPESIKDPLIRSYFENVPSSVGIKKFEEGIFNEEKEVYGGSRTNQNHLYLAHLELFKEENGVFINVCGDRIWVSDQPLLLEEYL